MCGVSVLCVDGDTAHAVSLSFVLMETPHMRCLCPLSWWRHRMCGVSVRGVVGDICLCLLFLQIFPCDCFCSICFFYYCLYFSANLVLHLLLTI